MKVIGYESLGKEGTAKGRATIEFIEKYIHDPRSKKLLTLLPWQRMWIMRLLKEHLVIYQRDDGTTFKARRRVVKNSLLSCARQQGKSFMQGALICAMLLGPLWTRGVVIVCTATTMPQARVLFNYVASMMRASPIFEEDGTFEIQKNSIFSVQHGATFTPVTGHSSQDGLHGLTIDHVFADEISRHKSLEVWSTLAEGVSTRPDSLVIAFSTMSESPNNPLAQLMRSVKARKKQGIDSRSWHVTLYQGDLEADPNPLSDWNLHKANPSARHMPDTMESLDEDRIQAGLSDYALARWKTTRLNIEGMGENQFIDPARWAAIADPKGRSRIAEFERRDDVYVGLDMSKARDLTACSMYWPKHKFLDAQFFLPSQTIPEHEAKHALPFGEWVEQGHILTNPGHVVDGRFVSEFLGRLSTAFRVRIMRYDKWGMDHVKEAMLIQNVRFPIEAVQMALYGVDPYIIAFENKVNGEEFTHSNTPILNYCMSCAQTEDATGSYSGSRRVVKGSDMDLIDGCISSMLAVGRSIKAEGLSLDDLIMPIDD